MIVLASMYFPAIPAASCELDLLPVGKGHTCTYIVYIAWSRDIIIDFYYKLVVIVNGSCLIVWLALLI